VPFGAFVPKEATYPRRFPLRVTFRVQGFSPSSRLAPPSASRVCFTPLTPFGFSLQGFPLPRSRAESSSTLCRLAVAPAVAHPPPRRRDLWRTNLHCLGVGHVPLADFTALLPLRVRSARPRVYAGAAGRAPLGLCPLQGLTARSDAVARHHRSSRVLELASAPRSYPRGPGACCTAEYRSPRS
jgi:hypothetical protein